MKKMKWLLTLAVLLVAGIFTYENWHFPGKPITLFGYGLPALPNSLIIFSCLLIGFLAGWLCHARRQKRRQQPTATEEKQ